MFQAENSMYRGSGEEKMFKELKGQSDDVNRKGESIKWGFLEEGKGLTSGAF